MKIDYELKDVLKQPMNEKKRCRSYAGRFVSNEKMQFGERSRSQRLSEGGKQRLPNTPTCHTHTPITPTNPPQETDLNRNISCS